MNPIFLLADRDSAANQWLRENPLVLSGVITVFGIVFLFLGISGLKSGKVTDKYGNEIEGAWAKFLSIFYLVFAALAFGAATYIALFGAW
ncbi:MAG: hypothetical protein AAFN77_01570 [Planctomycetota bacterium]